MTAIADYIAEVSSYISDDNTRAVLETLTQAEFDRLQAVSEDLTGDDEVGLGTRLAVTAETIADFDNSRATAWSEKGAREDVDGGVIYRQVQIAKGQQRIDLAVVPLGARTIVMTS